MAQVINTNIMSLNAQRNLNMSQASLATSMQRLSSGLRINSAKDDAAGLAISERFSTQIRGLNMAIRNANDGISLSQTAEGAMASITDNLQRIRELAVQARNATNSASDRAALDAEVQQRIEEVNRVATQTQFNGLNLLNGTFTAQAFQVGANQGQIIGIDEIANATAQALGLRGGTIDRYTATGVTVGTSPLLSGDLTINGVDIGAQAADARAIADGINALDTRYAASATNSQTIAFQDVTALGNKSAVSGAYTTATSQAAAVNGAAGQAWSMAVGGVSIYSEQQGTRTTVSGAFTGAGAGDITAAGQSYALSVGTVDVFSFTSTAGFATETITAADIDAAVAAKAAELSAAGFTYSGTAAAGTLQFFRTDGATFNTTVTDTIGTAGVGFAGADFATGSNAAETDTQISVTAAEIDAAVAARAATLAAAGISYTGTAAAGTLSFSRANGASFDVQISNNLTTAGGFANDFVTVGTPLSNGTSSVNNNDTYELRLNGAVVSVDPNANGVVTAQEVADAINALGGFTASNAGGLLTITTDDGSNFSLAETIANDPDLPDSVGAGFDDLVLANAGVSVTLRGTVSLASQIAVTIGGNNPGAAGLTAGATTAIDETYDAVNVLTAEAADQMLEIVDNALTTINNSRAQLGAIQNRFLTTIDNLQITAENLTASRSRIMDADFAQETANLSRAQILQQAGTAMVAQANQVPQGVLQLLQG